jgi:hypothetical protein
VITPAAVRARGQARAGQAGIDQQQLEDLRAAKAEERGGFGDRIIWFGNRPAAAAYGAPTRLPLPYSE